ncbi:MAG: HaeIII family restriction endonuclease [bacterium]
MAGQARAGKAFEYALLTKSYSILSLSHTVNIIQNNSYFIAQNAFHSFPEATQNKYMIAAEKGFYHILTLEPRLNHPINNTDNLILQLAQDSEGIIGDVRDVLFIRLSQDWEIGISAKNNHEAVKHSRLSGSIDFGNLWFGINCTENYWNTIKPIFEQLKEYKNNGILWRNLQNKITTIYIPLLNAFKNELTLQNTNHPGIIPARLLIYLLGNKDFYKVIKTRKHTSVFGFNLHGSLNKSAESIHPYSYTKNSITNNY